MLKKGYNYLSWVELVDFQENVILKFNSININKKISVIMGKKELSLKKELIYLAITIIACIATVMYVNSPAFKYFGKKMYKVAEIESLKIELSKSLSENADLRQALTAKMESLCDTMSVDQKLAQAKLDDYSIRMYEIKDAQEMKAYKQKEDAGMKAYKQKESADLKAFIVYQQKEAKLLNELEKKDPKVFLEYAIISFRLDKHNGSYNASRMISQQQEKIEKIPSVADFVKGNKEAWNIRMEINKKLEQEYSKNNASLELEYQKKLKIIGENFEMKIADKKVELGL
ncbi:MAG: hypothetical protein ACOYL8_02760 [Patescibacteria group bacterium]